MKNLSSKQIAQVRAIKTWTSTKFHGNTKKVGSLLVADLKAIVAKKVSRELAKIDTSKKSNVKKLGNCCNGQFKLKVLVTSRF